MVQYIKKFKEKKKGMIEGTKGERFLYIVNTS